MNRVFFCDILVGSVINVRVKSFFNVYVLFNMCFIIFEDCVYCSKRKKNYWNRKYMRWGKINGFVWEKGIFLYIFYWNIIGSIY